MRQTMPKIIGPKKRIMWAAPNLNCACLHPQSNKQILFDKHLKFCLSSTMFVGLDTTQTLVLQTFFCFLVLEIDKQNVLVKQQMFVVVAKVRNVCQTMSARLAGA